MMAFDVRRDRIRERHGADDVCADLRVDAHALVLVGRQPPRLREDVLGDRQLADVVQQRGHLHAFHLVRRHACCAGELRGSGLHAADVVVVRPMRSIEGLGARVDGERERLDAVNVQLGHLLQVPLLILDPAQIDPVAPIRQIQGRCRQQHHPDLHRHHDADREDGHAGADEAGGRRPHEVLLPQLQHRLAARERHRRCDQPAVAEEEGCGRGNGRLAQRQRVLAKVNPPSHAAVSPPSGC